MLSCAYTDSNTFLILVLPQLLVTPSRELGVHMEGTEPGQLAQTDRRDVPYRVTVCDSWMRNLPGLPLLREQLGIRQLAVCNCFLHHSFFFVCFAYLFVCLLFELFLPQPMSFMTFAFPFLSPSSCWRGVSKQSCGTYLPAKVNHDYQIQS